MSKHLPMVFDDELFGPVIADSRANETLVSGDRVSHETFEKSLWISNEALDLCHTSGQVH